MRQERESCEYPAWAIVWAKKTNLPLHWAGSESNLYGEGIPIFHSRAEGQEECKRLNEAYPGLIHTLLFFSPGQAEIAQAKNEQKIPAKK